MANTVFHVPKTVEGINNLMVLHKAEKAVLVCAFVGKGKQFPSAAKLAEREIVGLTSAGTISAYRTRGKEILKALGVADISPGDSIKIPANLEWKALDYRTDDSDQHDEFVQISKKTGIPVLSLRRAASNPEAHEAVIKYHSPSAERAARALTERNQEALERIREAGRKAADEADITTPVESISSWMTAQRKARKELADLLELTSDLPKDTQVVEIVGLAVAELRQYLDAIEQVVTGESMDAELAKLLGGAQ